jgi:cell division protein FtsB
MAAIERLRADGVQLAAEIARLKTEVAALQAERQKLDDERRTLQQAFIQCSTDLVAAGGAERAKVVPVTRDSFKLQEQAAQAQAIAAEAARAQTDIEQQGAVIERCVLPERE